MTLHLLHIVLVLILLTGYHLQPSEQFGWRGVQVRNLTPIDVYRNIHLVHSTTRDDNTPTSSSSASTTDYNDSHGKKTRRKTPTSDDDDDDDDDSSLEASRASLAAIVDRSWKKVATLIPHACLVQSTDEVLIDCILYYIRLHLPLTTIYTHTHLCT